MNKLEEELLTLLGMHEEAVRLDEALDYAGVMESFHMRRKANKAWKAYREALKLYMAKVRDIAILGDPPQGSDEGGTNDESNGEDKG